MDPKDAQSTRLIAKIFRKPLSAAERRYRIPCGCPVVTLTPQGERRETAGETPMPSSAHAAAEIAACLVETARAAGATEVAVIRNRKRPAIVGRTAGGQPFSISFARSPHDWRAGRNSAAKLRRALQQAEDRP